jgi:hypothetical protein
MLRRAVSGYVAIGALLALLAMPAAADAAKKRYTKDFMFDQCNGFSASEENPFFSLDPGDELTLRGKEDGEQLEVRIEVLNETENADGTQTRVVQETETADGDLTEISRNFFAICNRDNSVVYFGEEVDIYEDGEVVAHDGEWRAGDDGAEPGIIMPGTNLLGARYFQELAPGVALDRAETLSLSATVKTPAGTFEDCLHTVETTPLEKGTSTKFYAPGIGLIQDGPVKLVEYDV